MRRPEPWLVAYGLLGLTQSGLVPVLMPLAAPRAALAGLTFAAFSLSGIVAPVFGAWADRTGRHRDLLIGGTFAAGAFLLLFDAVQMPLSLLLAAGAGLGAAAATTAGNVIAIQGAPEDEWDMRVATLQRFVSGGQVLGLIVAGILARRHPGDGFIVAGGAMLAAGMLSLAPSRRWARSSAAAQQPGRRLDRQKLIAYLSVINRPMRQFLLIWLIAYSAMNGFAALFPVAMTRQFGMDPILPSAAYALGVGFSLMIYPLAGGMTHRRGGMRIYLTGLLARVAVLGPLAALGWLQIGPAALLALAGFALIQFVWPLIAVGTNSLSVRYAPTARAESVGLFNATTSLASATGSAAAGAIYAANGFGALAASAFGAVGAAIMLTAFWHRHRSSSSIKAA
jgi:MFS family permease